jgi:hypothetical protein
MRRRRPGRRRRKRRSENGTMDEGALAHSKESVIWHRYVSV